MTMSGVSLFVTPTKVGVQLGRQRQKLDSGFRRNDDETPRFVTPTKVGVQLGAAET
jgi:hypothetical protein